MQSKDKVEKYIFNFDNNSLFYNLYFLLFFNIKSFIVGLHSQLLIRPVRNFYQGIARDLRFLDDGRQGANYTGGGARLTYYFLPPPPPGEGSGTPALQ